MAKFINIIIPLRGVLRSWDIYPIISNLLPIVCLFTLICVFLLMQMTEYINFLENDATDKIISKFISYYR